MSTADELSEVGRAVEEILAKYPMARNSDFYLGWIYLREYLKVPLPQISVEEVQKIGGKFETCRRQRQKIQNDYHKYPPTDPEVIQRRSQREEDFRDWFGRHPQEVWQGQSDKPKPQPKQWNWRTGKWELI